MRCIPAAFPGQTPAGSQCPRKRCGAPRCISPCCHHSVRMSLALFCSSTTLVRSNCCCACSPAHPLHSCSLQYAERLDPVTHGPLALRRWRRAAAAARPQEAASYMHARRRPKSTSSSVCIYISVPIYTALIEAPVLARRPAGSPANQASNTVGSYPCATRSFL